MKFSPIKFSQKGGGLWKIKFNSTREYAFVTKEILTKEILPLRGRELWKIKFVSTREYAVVTKEILTKEILA